MRSFFNRSLALVVSTVILMGVANPLAAQIFALPAPLTGLSCGAGAPSLSIKIRVDQAEIKFAQGPVYIKHAEIICTPEGIDDSILVNLGGLPDSELVVYERALKFVGTFVGPKRRAFVFSGVGEARNTQGQTVTARLWMLFADIDPEGTAKSVGIVVQHGEEQVIAGYGPVVSGTVAVLAE